MRSRWIVAGVSAVVLATGAAVFARSAAASPVRPGTQTLGVYTVDEEISTTGQRPNWFGRLMGMCDADTYYVQIGGEPQCLVTSGPYGEITVTGTRKGAEITAAEAGRALDAARREDPKVQRVVLQEKDGPPVAIADVTALSAGTPVVATTLD